jgi:2-succinyl-5-enolpyruvyl-6-hydroxy-3-cyclohexene-1-carboxylate synthase
VNRPNASENATFCAALVDQWILEGLTAAYIAPGSRSTPLALAFADRDDIAVELYHDERSASFAALGHGLITGTPAAVVCTSGTAGAHFYAAVIEADLSAVPLLVCTADRPPELWGRGAPQTINQTDLYGASVREFVQPGPPDELDRRRWRGVAQQAWASSMGIKPGPVQLNLSFREPLAGVADDLPSPLDPLPTRVRPAADSAQIADLADRMSGQRGVIIAGRGESAPADVLALAAHLGWPVIADHRSGCRTPDHPNVVERYDSLLRHRAFSEPHRPDVILRLGEIVSSKAVSQWLSRCEATVLTGRPQRRHIDPEDIATISFDEAGVAAALIAAIETRLPADTAWLQSWRRCDDLAEATIAERLDRESVNEVAIARRVVAETPAGGALVVASSMPVRDVEWFGQPRADIDVVSNRGANGIDGTIATAAGIARTGRATVCLIGDVALLHDSTSLAALRHRPLDLTIVVVDNDGGGIFSFLPQHELLSADRYEQLFGTPHGTDLARLAEAHGIPVERWPGDLAPSGVRMVLAHTNRDANLALHDELHAAVAAALGAAPVLPR